MNQKTGTDKDFAGRVLEEAKEFYHKTMSVYESTGYNRAYQTGHMWGSDSGNMRDLHGLIESDTDAISTIRHIDNTILYSVNPPDSIKEKMVDWYLSYLKDTGNDLFKMDTAIQASPITDPEVSITREGRLLNPDFLRRVIYYLEIRKYCEIPESGYRIVELGGGCGHLARALKLLMPDGVHIDIDLPETLHLAYLFTRLNFPESNTCYVTDPSQLADGIDQYDFIFIPTKFAESVLSYEFDLFCNTVSIGEMSNQNIRQWMDFIQNRLKVKYFFGLNRYLNTIPQLVNQEIRRKNENEGSVLFDSKWKILQWELTPQFARCPYEEPTRANQNLEIIAQRLPDSAVDEEDNRAKSRKIIEELMDEDWIRCRELYLNTSMRVPALANDLTMNGTLFKLWDSIRLYPNKTNVALMLIYLTDLTKKGYPYEEWFYYRNLLITLKDDSGSKKQADLWKYALSLSVSYNPFDIKLLYHFFMRFLPYRLRMSLIGFIGKIYSRIRKISR